MQTGVLPSASRRELRRGVDAAQQVFNRAGISAETPLERRNAGLWEEADQAALEACCQDWTGDRIPSEAGLWPLFESDHSEAAERMRAIYREN